MSELAAVEVTEPFTPPKRGRKTAEEEARAYLANLGLDPSSVLDALKERGEVDLPDDATMLDEFKKALYTQMRTGQLKSTALVNGLRAVAVLSATAKPEAPDGFEPERGIDQILADAGLPSDRRLEIGERELARLRERTVALETTLEQIGATA